MKDNCTVLFRKPSSAIHTGILHNSRVDGWMDKGRERSSFVRKLSLLVTQLDYVTVLKSGNIRRDITKDKMMCFQMLI